MPSKPTGEQRVWLYDALKLMLPDTGAAIMISGLLAPKLAERERQVRLDEAKEALLYLMRCEGDWTWRVFKDLYLEQRIAALERGEASR